MIRVANIVEEGKLGGPQVRIANVACALKERVETTVIMPIRNSVEFRTKLDKCGIKYKTFNLSRITKEVSVAARYLLLSWYEIYQLVKYFRQERFDLIHVSGGSWQYKGVIAGKISGTKVVWHLNDTSMPWLFRKIFSLFSDFPLAYIYASKCTQQYYSALVSNKKPGFVIPAPVNTSFFSPVASIEGDEELIKSWEGKIVIGTVANVSPVKGLDIFVRVAAALNQKNSDLIFVIIGSITDNQKPLYKKLNSMMKDLGAQNVIFVGSRVDTRAIVKRMDIYLCTSYAESSPIAVWEAMSMAKAIVSTAVGDVPLYIESGVSGDIAEVADVTGIEKKVSDLIADSERRSLYGKAAREVMVTKLDIDYCAEKHYLAYKSCLV